MRKMNDKLYGIVKQFYVGGKITARFRAINIIFFLIVSVLVVTVMSFVLQNITDTVSKDYARLYSANTIGTLNTYFGRELALIRKAAHSNAVINWFMAEDNQEKKAEAYEEMMGIIDVLASDHLYIGIDKTLHEYSVEDDFTIEDIQTSATLAPDVFDDQWYFDCVASADEYQLNVDIDKIFHRKRVWLNYKVTHNGTLLGVLCTGMEFSSLVEKLFSEYDRKSVRGLVMDENGTIYMDSDMLGDDDFLHYTIGGEYRIEDEFTDPQLISAVNEYLKEIDGYFNAENTTTVIALQAGQYQYATIAPIASTKWSVVTFYNSSSLFNAAKLLPLFIFIPAMFIIFIVATSIASTKLIFAPFEKLINSISHLKVNMNERVYGTSRRDEIGSLANTVQDMKDSLIDALGKVHYDALTGIYNRRFMEENLNRIIKSLSRSGGVLSVILLDIDYFKEYNDTYGHPVGDTCLKTVANALAISVVRTDDFAARYGGEEFIIVLPNTDEYGAGITAQRVLEKVKACEIPHAASKVANYVTVSMGITTEVVKYTHRIEDYITHADEALYKSKQEGRNRITVYTQ